MALILDATVGGAGSNSYVSIEEADSYLDYRFDNAAWSDATDDEKISALVMACEQLEQYGFNGVKCTTAQRLSFPRYYSDVVRTTVYDMVVYANNALPIMPKNLKKAQILEANEIIKSKADMVSGTTTRADLIKQGVTSVTLGENSETYDRNMVSELRSKDAQRLLAGIIRRGY